MSEKSIKQITEEFKKLIPMYEMSMAWISKQNNKCVWVENPSGHNNKYFKYLNGASYQKADRVARISMLKPAYLEHVDYDGKDNWKLTSKEKKELVDLMRQTNKKYAPCTNWQAVLITYNEDNFAIDFDETINGTFDKTEFPDALDINYPMPEYTKLGE